MMKKNVEEFSEKSNLCRCCQGAVSTFVISIKCIKYSTHRLIHLHSLHEVYHNTAATTAKRTSCRRKKEWRQNSSSAFYHASSCNSLPLSNNMLGDIYHYCYYNYIHNNDQCCWFSATGTISAATIYPNKSITTEATTTTTTVHYRRKRNDNFINTKFTSTTKQTVFVQKVKNTTILYGIG